jgi:3-oxoacyl-[acyl-carrier protein] reductase
MNLARKTCLVTGGTKGIGASVATTFAKAGADVSINGRSEDQEGRELLARLRGLGIRAHLAVADVSKPQEAVACVEETCQVLGAPDVLVHCAGEAAPGDIAALTPERWNAAFDIHIHAIFHLCRALLPHMEQKTEGAIILVSSAAGLRGCLNSLAYGVVKGALPQFTRGLARDLAVRNIRVNCVAPGVIRTRFQDYLTPDQVATNLDNRIPLRREGTPRDVAKVIEMLVTNDFITGETVSIDGGMTMRIA